MDEQFIKQDGSLLAARYAFMPNKMRYCGGDSNSELFSYVSEGEADDGLKHILEEFATMYPYLKLIADANKILDPFNYRVVEAYWIGNELLENISMNKFYNYMLDKQELKKKFKPVLLEKVFGKIPMGAKPHHSWHVLNIPKQKGYYPVEQSLETMEKCRIGWGKIKAVNDKENQGNDIIGKLKIEYQPFVMENGQLKFGDRVEKYLWSEINDKAFVVAPKVGDWVSFHWDWVCDLLTDRQVKNLHKWTQHNLNLVNV